jgi:PII-like signaling protein
VSAERASARTEALRISAYFGEHDRHRGRFLSEAILDGFERRRLAAGLLLRGAEGFGAGQRLRADRLLSLSEDLPLLALGVGPRSAVEELAEEIAALMGDGLLALERARLAADGHGPGAEPHQEVKLSLFLGRRRRARGAPAHVAAVAALHRHGVAGATVLLGVDGTAAGRRLRARFLSGNADVPALVVAVGEREAVGRALTEIEGWDEPPAATVEAVTVCRRDGLELGRAPALPERDASGLALWRRLTVFCSERSEHQGRTLYLELIRRLRAAGAAGATAVRGVWGYHGDHAPHGDRLLALRRHVPVVVEVIDTPSACERWLGIAAELTAETGLVTAEALPALRVSGPGGHLEGGLRLAEPRR